MKLGLYIVVFSLFSVTAQADFLSPGELAESHYKVLKGITKCTTCHTNNRDLACLTCHKDIDEKIKTKLGWHFKNSKKHCQLCHTEHRGREFDLMGLNPSKFNHAETGWPLTGKHETLKCEECHTQKRTDAVTGKKTKTTTYLGNSPLCVSCHKDVHNDQFGQKCQDCHSTLSWIEILKPSPTPKASIVGNKKENPLQTTPKLPVKKVSPKLTPTPIPTPSPTPNAFVPSDL